MLGTPSEQIITAAATKTVSSLIGFFSCFKKLVSISFLPIPGHIGLIIGDLLMNISLQQFEVSKYDLQQI